MVENVKLIDIINGISQAALQANYGANEAHGNNPEVGIRRDQKTFKDPKIHSTAVPLRADLKATGGIIDGFKVFFSGNKLKIVYESEMTLKEVYRTDFEQKIYDVIENCVAFLKKEYKKTTKSSLKVKILGEPDIKIEHLSAHRTILKAGCLYEIDGIDDPEKLLDQDLKDYRNKFDKWATSLEKKNFKDEKKK